jgi:hypothetical protein
MVGDHWSKQGLLVLIKTKRSTLLVKKQLLRACYYVTVTAASLFQWIQLWIMENSGLFKFRYATVL